MLRRAGFAATIAAGVGLLGASFHGMTSVDHQLKLAAATPVPSAQEPIQYWHGDGDSGGRNCDKPVREHHRPEV